jgi:glutathione synthase/RimK-type ligase-like ATP-grasp enzyme
MNSNDYLIGFAGLGRMLGSGVDIGALGPQLEQRIARNPRDASAMLDISTLCFITRNEANRAAAFEYQQRALKLQQVYRLAPAAKPALRLLVVMAPGDMTSNTPVDCLLENSNFEQTLVYALPGRMLPAPLPDHDVVFVAVGESPPNQVLLRQLVNLRDATSKPIVNRPERIARLVRDTAYDLLASTPGVLMADTVRVDRETLHDVHRSKRALHDIADELDFPIIVRPLDSQGGKDLDKLDGIDDLAAYLERVPASIFFVARFIDYRSRDGQFRKCRVVLVDGRPFASHMGVSSNWMIHYVNAAMDESADKRADEERFFATFDQDFAAKHTQSLAAVNDRLGLDYVSIDCAEAPDGRLVIFEVDNAAIVHAFDDPQLYPYKLPAMQKVFDAFRAMLSARARAASNRLAD